MKHYFITGTSRGLGKALAELFLEDSSSRVMGIGRTCSIEHENYTHVHLDLADTKAVERFSFPPQEDTAQITLINNAGIIGDVKPFGKLAAAMVTDTFSVNLVSPAILCNSFVAAYANNSANKVIVNVSSGAGKHPIGSWGSYCATKAGLDLMSEVMELEQQEHAAFPVKVYSMAPGLVDSAMQEEIRTVSSDDFSRLDDFVAYKAQGDLVPASDVALKYAYLIENRELFPEVVYSVRDL